eukprot:TRINITY_DN49860_c0_g1_i1.p1 TRINITY_DN49860_c0_g1~~TRINITY_DN49860_c0_g1_i1.p1  ORF type:complete len:654 (+),score=159.54 TRINITY_DN49860_c0_g1_i1:149-2110(+)
MEFVTATKEGLIVFDALSIGQATAGDDWTKGATVDGNKVKVIAKLPSPDNAFGHAWSNDGVFLGSVTDEGVSVYNASEGYELILELPRVAPDVGGRTGGVRNLRFSPKNSFLVTYEKWDPQYPKNCHVWDLRPENKGARIYSCVLKGYTSGALPVEMIRWNADETLTFELIPGEAIVIRPFDLEGAVDTDDAEGEQPKTRKLSLRGVAHFQVGTQTAKGSTFIACYVPESGVVAKVFLYNLVDVATPLLTVSFPAKIKDMTIMFNPLGSELLALATSDVDETGNSYFGNSYLYWVSCEGGLKPKHHMVCGQKEGVVQDLAWSPTKNEFALVYGMMPATVALFDGKTGQLISTLGASRRNTLKWNPFGRFLAVGGFGTLPGDIDFFDRSCEETVSSMRAALTVLSSWAPDGQHFLCSTVAPRMNEGNQLSVYRYSGELVFKIEFKPAVVQARHEDTGGGARTKTQALLFSASWRPCCDPSKYEDKPATPRTGPKRKKGLPDSTEAVATTTTTAAYRPKAAAGYGGAGAAGGGNLVAAMMRGEINLPEPAKSWDTPAQEAKPLEEWEVRKLMKEQKKEAEKKELAKKEAEKQALRQVDQAVKDNKQKLKELRATLDSLQELKEKEWDDLTSEDEAVLEGEMEMRAQIAELEKKCG